MKRVPVGVLIIFAIAGSAAWVTAYLLYPNLVVPLGIPAILFLIVGVFLMIRRKGNWIGPVLFIGSFSWLIYDLGSVYATVSLSRAHPLPGEHLAAWLGAWTGPIFYLSVPALLVLYPVGDLSGRRRWFLIPMLIVLVFAVVGAAALYPLPTSTLIDSAALSSIGGAEPANLAWVVSWWLVVPAAISLLFRYRTGTVLERQQMKWLLASVVVAPVLAAITVQIPSTDRWDMLIVAVAASTLPLAIGIAVLRYRLYDLGRIVSRTVTYAVVVGLLGGVFSLGVVVFPRFVTDERAPAWVVAISTLAAAVLFNPLRKQIQSRVDRRFNRSRYDVEKVMDRFAGSLRNRVDPEGVVAGWVGVVSETMQPAGVGVWVRGRSEVS